MDGYLVGAQIFWDCNDNFIPDVDEEVVVSGTGGRYTIGSSKLGICPLRALVPSSAIDEDTGQPVGSPYRLAAISGAPEVISPLTTAISLGLGSVSELQSRFPASMSFPVSADYIAAGAQGAQAHNAAKYFAVSLQLVDGLISSGEPAARAAAVKLATDFIPSSAYSEIDSSGAKIQSFKSILPSQSQLPSALAATLDKADFEIVEDSLSGSNDPRRKFVESALATIKKYPGAIVGSTVRWSMVPESERATWAPFIVDGKNGFSDPARAREISAFVKQKQQEAAAEIAALEDKTQASLAAMQAKHVFGLFATSADSLVKLYPASSTARRVLGVTKAGKLRPSAIRAQASYDRIKNLINFGANCSSLGLDFLSIIDSDSAQISKLADTGLTLARCVAQVALDEKAVTLFKTLSDGKAAVPATVDGDLIEFLKAMSDLASDAFDVAGAGPASALYNETVGMLINHFYNTNQQLKKISEYSGKLDDVLKAFNSVIDESRGLMISARLEPYIRPKHLIYISLPSKALVGEDVIGSIDQRLGQPIAYNFSWGRYPNNTLVAADSTWSSAGGSTILAPVRYLLPGTYIVVIELSDNTFGSPIAAFQVLTQTIEISCPAGTTPDPDGTCRTTPSRVLFDDFRASSIDSTIWNTVGSPTIGAGFTQFPALSRINTQGKVSFKGGKIVIEARLAGQGGSRDTSIQLVDIASGDYIYSGDTSYFGWGFFAFGSGAYNFVETERPSGVGPAPQNCTALGGSTNQFLEYRWTLEGNKITFERGPTLSQITQSATRTLGKSIVGAEFYLSIGTAGPSYSPGTWDWVRVSSEAAPPSPTSSRYEVISCGTWSQCRDAAVALGGQLVTIRSEADNAKLVNLFPMNQNYWIGATNDGIPGAWRWLSGASFSYSRWGTNLNNVGGIENCAHFYDVTPGFWNDLRCDSPGVTKAIVEYLN